MDIASYPETVTVSPSIAADFVAIPATPSAHLPEKARSVPDLIALAQALDTMVTIANALTSTAGMQNRSGVLNDAGSELDDITDILVERHLAVMERLRDAQPVTKREAEDRAVALVRWDLEVDQDVTDKVLAAVR